MMPRISPMSYCDMPACADVPIALAVGRRRRPAVASRGKIR
jgi:hypothetical protein